jgi:hypothetical protein
VSFLKVSSRLCGELAPTQRLRPAQLAPTLKLAPTEVLKNCPLITTDHYWNKSLLMVEINGAVSGVFFEGKGINASLPGWPDKFIKNRQKCSHNYFCWQNWSTFVLIRKNKRNFWATSARSKQSPNSRKFTQSGHPDATRHTSVKTGLSKWRQTPDSGSRNSATRRKFRTASFTGNRNLLPATWSCQGSSCRRRPPTISTCTTTKSKLHSFFKPIKNHF